MQINTEREKNKRNDITKENNAENNHAHNIINMGKFKTKNNFMHDIYCKYKERIGRRRRKEKKHTYTQCAQIALCESFILEIIFFF